MYNTGRVAGSDKRHAAGLGVSYSGDHGQTTGEKREINEMKNHSGYRLMCCYKMMCCSVGRGDPCM